ncbi:MAG: hypothetical protein IJH75_06555 [Mogibacterium sp.]|nr:hypothetical protein [Mogibacterium sp.]
MKGMKKSTIALMIAGIIIGLACLIHNTVTIARMAEVPNNPYEHEEIAADLGSVGDTVTLKGRARFSPYAETGSLLEVYRIEDDAFYMLYSNDPKFFNNVEYDDFFEVTGVIMDRTEELRFGENVIVVPVVEVQEFRYGDYIEIFDPTVETVEVGQSVEKSGIRVDIDKIEFAENGTRIYASIYNDADEYCYCAFNYDVEVLQGSTRYKPLDSEIFWEYEWHSFLDPGEKSSGVMFLEPGLERTGTIGVIFNVCSDSFESYSEPFEFRIELGEEALPEEGQAPDAGDAAEETPSDESGAEASEDETVAA